MQTILISTVIPVYRGSEYLEELVKRIGGLRDRLNHPESPIELTEAIFVDDAAVDMSPNVLKQLQTKYEWVKVVTLSRNFGQHCATVAGILHSCGDWVCTLDEDLQHDPAYITAMLKHAVEQQSDIVYASADAVHETKWRDLCSRWCKASVAKLSNNENIRYCNSFRMIRGSVARAAASVVTYDTYLDIALSWFSQRLSTLRLPMKDQRFIDQKTSGYSLSSLLEHARRMVVSSHVKILRMGAALGVVSMLSSIGMILFYLFKKIFFSASIPVRGWTSLVLLVLFFGGLLSFLVGISLEYMSILLMKAQGKPAFFVVDRRQDETLQDFFSRSTLDRVRDGIV